MKVRFLGVTQETYRSMSTKPPIRTLQVSKGAVIDLPDDKVKQLRRDYPLDWEVLTPPGPVQPQVSEPAAVAASAEPEQTKGDESVWTRKRAAKK